MAWSLAGTHFTCIYNQIFSDKQICLIQIKYSFKQKDICLVPFVTCIRICLRKW